MRISPRHSAILIFTRTARDESAAKGFDNLTRRTESITRSFIDHTLSVTAAVNMPVFLMSGFRQRGTTFGEKFTNAISDVFDQGFEKVIAVGTDTPGLTSMDLLEAAEKLRENKIVFGSSDDGGIYLLGISRHCFDPGELSSLPWQRSRVQAALKNYASSHDSAYCVLTSKYPDADTMSDLFKLVHIKNLNRAIHVVLGEVLLLFGKYFTVVTLVINEISRSGVISRRGPPLVV